MTKPIHVFWSPLSGRFYASRAYKEIKPGVIEITGEKFDVTDEIAELILKNNITFKEADGHDKEATGAGDSARS